MVAIPTQNIAGVNVTQSFAPVDLVTAPEYPGLPFVLGERIVGTDGSQWMFAKASGTVTAFDTVMIGSTFLAASITSANALLPGFVAFNHAAGTLATTYSAWFMLSGVPTINVLGSCLKDVPLYTTDTAGALDDATASSSQVQVMGVILTTTISSTTASSQVAVANSVSIRRPAA